MKNKGFTLLELMMVVAIIAILAAIVMPNYSSYITKSKVSQLIAYAAPVKAKTAGAIATNSSSLMSDANALAVSTTSTPPPYIASITVNTTTGIITVTSSSGGSSNLPADAQSKTIIFTPSLLFNANPIGVTNISWTCSGTMPSQYIPSNCQ